MPAEDPAAIERRMYVDLVLGGVDDPNLSLAELRDRTGGGVNANKSVSAASGDSALAGVGVSTIWSGSQAAYDAITAPDPDTLYFVTG